MRSERSASRLIAQVLAVGAVATALTVAIPDIYHDMRINSVDSTIVVTDSVTTPGATPDIYHDM
jgi:hypothetical protein